jgi:hypothetical protein
MKKVRNWRILKPPATKLLIQPGKLSARRFSMAALWIAGL